MSCDRLWRFFGCICLAGSGDGADCVALAQVLFSVVEGGKGKVADGAVGGEDEMFDICGFEFGFKGFDEGLVEGLAGGFDGVDVAEVFELVAKLGDGGGEGFCGDVGFKGSEGDAALVGFEGEEELDFVFEDERIDEDGAVLGVDDAAGFFVELFRAEGGAFGAVMLG